MITDVSSPDEAGAQLVRLDAHFQADYRARRARLHHVLPSPRMRALKGMWRSVAVGEGNMRVVATLPAAISAAIREDFGTKTEVSHDKGFISVLHRGLLFGRGKNSQVNASPNSRATDGPRLPRGIPRFLCRDLPLELCLFAGRRDRRFNDSRYSDDKSDTGDNRERPDGSKVGKSKSKANPF